MAVLFGYILGYLFTMSDKESSTPAPTPPFPLLELPPEIRNRIWTLVVTVERVFIKRSICRKPSGKHPSPTTMALASTCRQIYHEVAPIYYSKNLFYFPAYQSIDLPRQFAAAIGPANAESITAVQISIAFGFEVRHCTQQSLKELLPFPNLKTVLHSGFEHTFEHFCHKLISRIDTLPDPMPWW